MKKLFKSVLVALGTLPTAFLADARPTNFSADLLEETRGIVQFQQGKNSGGQADLLVPFYGNNNEFLFTNIQAYQYGSQYQTLSGGLGGRSLKSDAVYGLYGFYDFQTLNNKYTYHRYNIGAERFDGTWELRTNLYYYANSGIKNITDLGQTGAFIQGTNINYNHLYDVEQSYNLGGDFEVGRTLGLKALRGYLAYYNYGGIISGGRVRASYDIGARWQLVGSGQYDAARGWLAYGGVNYWMGKAKTNTGKAIDHLRDPIVRDMTIGVKKVNSYNQPDTDTRHIYFASPTGSATGTGAENDPLTLDAALSKSNAGDFVYLSNGTYTLDSVINLKAGQTLWGTGANLNVTSALGNTYVLKNAVAGTSPVIDASATTLKGFCGIPFRDCAIYVDQDNTTLGGFTLDGFETSKPRYGFNINNATNVNLSDITVQNFTATDSAGLFIKGTSQVVVNNIHLNRNEFGLSMRDSASSSGNSVSITNSGSYGVQLTGSAHIDNASGWVVQYSLYNGLYLTDTSSVMLANASISGNASLEPSYEDIRVSNNAVLLLKEPILDNTTIYNEALVPILIENANGSTTRINTGDFFTCSTADGVTSCL